MNKKINDIITFLFNKIPYSEQTENAKLKITSVLTDEYEKRLAHETEIEALGYIMSNFGSLESAAKLAGYHVEEIKEWSEIDQSINLLEVQRIFGKARRNIYLFSFILTLTAFFLCNLILFRNMLYIILFTIALLISSVFFKKFSIQKVKYVFGNVSYSPESHKYICDMYDKYGKRLLNGIVIGIFTVSYLIFVDVIMIVSTHSKMNEVVQYICGNLGFFYFILYINIKNLLCKVYTNNFIFSELKYNYKKHLSKVLSASVIYWLIITMIIILYINRIEYLFNIFTFAWGAYILILPIYNFTLRKNIVFRNISVNFKRIIAFFLIVTIVCAYGIMRLDSWLIQPYISTVATINHTDDKITYNEDNGIYTITSAKEDFKILQLTDIHLGGSALSAPKDLKALEAVYKLIEFTRPDLVIVTGDLVFPMGIMSFSMNNHTPIIQFSSFMRNIGIPWAFVYGNHDTEFMATSSAEKLNELFKSISYKNSQNLLYPYIQPDITGRNNQIIEIRNIDGTLNQALFLLDSNAYTGEGINSYDYIHDDQVEWYERNVIRLKKQENKNISSMLFFHMPLQEYRDAYKLYEENSKKVTYFFGENREKMINKVCCSDYHSRLFETALRLKSTKAMFCGHDHYNNLSVEYKGIRLTYGMSIDYLAMPGIEDDTAQRGGTLITLHSNSDFDIEQIRLTSLT